MGVEKGGRWEGVVKVEVERGGRGEGDRRRVQMCTMMALVTVKLLPRQTCGAWWR
jgi:hypothetical protein